MICFWAGLGTGVFVTLYLIYLGQKWERWAIGTDSHKEAAWL